MKKIAGKKGAVCVFIFAIFFLVVLGVVPAPGVGEKEFLVKSFTPNGLVSGRVEIKAVFNREAVPPDIIGKNLSAQEMPFSFSPAILGNGKWLDACTFAFYPKAGILSSATSYTAAAKANLKDNEMRTLSGQQAFSFYTKPLKFIAVRQVDFNPDEEETIFELEFSLPVSPSRLRGYLEVVGKGGDIEYKIQQGPASRKIRVSVYGLLNAGDATLKLAKDFTSESGKLGLERNVSVYLNGSLKMMILQAGAVSNMDKGEVYIETTAPVDFSRAEGFIEISPKLPYNIEPRDRGFAITGNFAPQDRLRVTIKKGFPSVLGKPLASDWNRAFIFPEKKPEIRFCAPGRILSPLDSPGLFPSLRLPVETMNIDTLRVTVWKLHENNIPIGMRTSWEDYPVDLSAIAAEKNYKVNGARNKIVRSALDLKPLLGNSKGVFLVTAQHEGEEWAESRQVINVTDLGVTMKKGESETLFWVNSVKDGTPIDGADVTLWSWANQPLGHGVTGKDGTVLIVPENANSSESPVLATVKKKDDVSFVRIEGGGLFNGRDEFDVDGENWISKGYSAFCYLPRGVFRPGENVSLYAVVRNAKGEAPEPFPVNIKLRSPSGRITQTQAAKLNKEGVLSCALQIPKGAPLGTWVIELYTPGKNTEAISYKDFYVEEFAAPRLFVESVVKPTRFVNDESGKISISSKYAFGNPAANLPYEIEVIAEEDEYRNKSLKGFTFTDVEKEFKPIQQLLSSGRLDKDGKAEDDIKGMLLESPSMAMLNIRTGVMEEGGRWAYRTVKVPWYPSNVLVGLLTQEDTSQGDAIKFKAAAVTPEGAFAKASELDYSFFRVVERTALYGSEGKDSARRENELILKSKGTLKLENGMSEGTVNPTESGKYLLRVADKVSGAKSSRYIYAYGGTDNASSTAGTVSIITDKQTYKEGETAKVKIKAPFAGRLLLCVETYKVVHKETLTLSDKGQEVRIKITSDMAPNAWITASVIRNQQNSKDEVRSYGVAPLYIDNSAKKLSVEIKNKERIEPGKNDFSLTVKDKNGHGVEASVTVMLVDEAILGLTGYKTPDPWGFLSSKRRLAVDTFDLYSVLIARENAATKNLIAGGGPADMSMSNTSLNPVQAKRFKMLSLAKTVRSDAKGNCDFSFVVPEFAGKARIMAVVASAKESGSAQSAVNINRDVVVEAPLPRILAPDDEITVPCRIFNKNAKTEKFSLDVAVQGELSMASNLSEDIKSMTIKQGSSKKLVFRFKAKNVGTAKISYKVVWDGGSVSSATELAVRPASPKTTESASFVLESGKSREIKLPASWTKGTFSGSVFFSAAPSVSMAELSRFLVSYPHGCLEQTISSAWPLLLQPDLLKGTVLSSAAQKDFKDDKAVRDEVARAIQKIYGFQNYDGSFVRFSGESWPAQWETVYAVHFLVEAKDLGFRIQEDVLSPALAFIKGSLGQAPSDPDNAYSWRKVLSKRAYICYVLALAKDPQLGWMESLRDKQGSLDTSGRLFLAAAYSISGQKKKLKRYLERRLLLSKPLKPTRNQVAAPTPLKVMILT